MQASLWADQLRLRDLKTLEKSATAGLRKAKQRESYADHEYHLPGHNSLGHSSREWEMRQRLWRSVLERGIGLAVWRQP